MEIPTARVMKEGRFRIGVSQIDPYRYYYGAVSPWEGFEIDGRVTETLGVEASKDTTWANYGNTKDKAIDFKYQVIPESKWLPAIAVGWMDPHGTRLYSSQYVVMSKLIYPFDLTVGFGNGRYGKRPLSSSGDSFRAEIITDHSRWRSEGQFFGGIQFFINSHLSAMVEYNPIKYELQSNDPARQKYFSDPVSSRFNFGLCWRPFDWLEAALSYQRGGRFGVNLSADFELGKPLIPIYDHPYKEKALLRVKPIEERIATALVESGFSDVGVVVIGSKFLIDAANRKYYDDMKAVFVGMQAIAQIIPSNGVEVHFYLTKNGIVIFEFTAAAEDIAAFNSEELTSRQFLYLSHLETNVWKRPDSRKYVPDLLDYELKPDFKLFLNDPSGFLKFRLGLVARGYYTPWKGATLAAGLFGYPVNNISSSNEPSSKPVRTDFVAYQEEKIGLEVILFNQIEKFTHEIYGRIAAGLLEEEYAGLDVEVAKPLLRGRFFAGLGGSVVRKRDPENPFAFKEDDWKKYYTTAFFNLRVNIPEADITVDFRNGRFLAGDRGTRITVSKNFNGVILSAWYSITDTSIFSEPYNRGYHDKGIAVSIPFRLFTGKDKKSSYKISLSPWTRDAAQDISHFNELFDFIGRDAKVYIDKDLRMIH